MNNRIEEQKELFEYWLFEMDDVLENFTKRFKKDNLPLDYSVTSLNYVESLILSYFPDIEEIKKTEHKHFYDELARYVGETFRKNIGGTWKLDIERESSAYYGLPILDYPTPICPHRFVTATIDRKKGTFLSTILTNNSNP